LPSSIDQIFTSLSVPEVAASLPSGETAIDRTQGRCAAIVRIGLGFSSVAFHQISLPSHPPESTVRPSGANAIA
jgi:hypothetical protein